jgi:cytochrome c
MDSLEFNKFAGAILVALMLVMVVDLLGDALVGPEPAGQDQLAVASKSATPKAKPATMATKPKAAAIGTMLAAADAEAGKKAFSKCKACHTLNKGGANRVGPNLWGIVGRPVAGAAGFSYSKALRALGGKWDYERLSQYLLKPKDFAPGTKMSFGGLAKPADRANLIAFLRSLSDAPKPLP